MVAACSVHEQSEYFHHFLLCLGVEQDVVCHDDQSVVQKASSIFSMYMPEDHCHDSLRVYAGVHRSHRNAVKLEYAEVASMETEQASGVVV